MSTNTPIKENGKWSLLEIQENTTNDPRIGIMSDDFTHDAVLWVSGDFTDISERIAFAEEIAKRLNAFQSPGDTDLTV
ncbi:hypothetical protein ACI2KR_09225 [Pseudomonas luteola]